jgi:hypothetical protein
MKMDLMMSKGMKLATILAGKPTRNTNFFKPGQRDSAEDPYETPLNKKMISGIKPLSTTIKKNP